MRGSVSASWMAALALAGVCAGPAIASAHVSVTSPVYAGATTEITFGVGHGCAGADTLKVVVEIPTGLTSVRALPSEFGRASVQKDAAQTVTSVTWEKPEADLYASDDMFYKLAIRAKIPAQPFTTLYFKTHQTCKKPDGETIVTDWVGTVQTEAEGAGTVEPAPAMFILPARKPGWNKITVPVAIADLAKIFDDAQVVWKGTAAFSTNPVTVDLIKATAGVTQLTTLAAGDEIWVKY
jgi:periplasmic copper chaperone A